MATAAKSTAVGLARFRDARDAGGAFISGNQRADGSFPGCEMGAGTYWGLPIALMASGHSNGANRLLAWVRSNALTADGDIGPAPDKASNYYYAYEKSWLIEAAHRLGQFDISQKGMEFMMDFWDPESGGFYSSYSGRGAETLQDLWVTAGCGRAAIYAGRMDVARGVGRFMRTLMEAQPDYPRHMFTVYSRAVGLHTEPDPDDGFRYLLSQDERERDQSFFHPGIAGGFLARLYQATGDQEWLDLSMAYMRFAEGASDHLFTLPGLRQGKTGWAAAVLYTLTGERRYRDMAVRVGDSIISHQADGGYWFGLDEDRSPNLNLTGEMVTWMDEIYQAVGHG